MSSVSISTVFEPARAERDESRRPPGAQRGHHLRMTGRSSSHYTRVARMAAHHLEVEFEFAVVDDLLALTPHTFAGHPGLKIPVLHVGDVAIWGTEAICGHLRRLSGAPAQVLVMPAQIDDHVVSNAQELVWQAMQAQVQWRLGVSIGKLPPDHAYFRKVQASIEGILAWLDARVVDLLERLPAPREASVFELTTFALVDHLRFCPTVDVRRYAQLCQFADRWANRPEARLTPYAFDRQPSPLST